MALKEIFTGSIDLTLIDKSRIKEVEKKDLFCIQKVKK